MTLTKKVENAYVSYVGNRVTFAGNLMMGAGFYNLSFYFYDRVLNHAPASGSSAMMFILGHALFFTGISAMGNTLCGEGTLTYYQRTKEHIQRKGSLDQRMIELWITQTTENQKYLGYCQLQGMYLAAKKYKQLEPFYKAKRKVSRNKVPNF
ncbi:MAG: hypothetical protein AABX05_01515 [Nanoarchaeota archaeon]